MPFDDAMAAPDFGRGGRRDLTFAAYSAIRVVVACVLVAAAVMAELAKPAAAQVDLTAATAKVCAVMSGSARPDGQSMQLLMMLNGGLSDGNPVALGLQRGVLATCPKAYLAYQRRTVVNNPYRGGLLSGSSTLLSGSSTLLPGKPQRLLTPGTDSPLVCRGGPGMATVAGNTLTLAFVDPHHRAPDGLAARQCSWMDRALRPGEPRNVQATFAQSSFATGSAKTMDGPATYTFYVHNWKNVTFIVSKAVKGFPPAR